MIFEQGSHITKVVFSGVLYEINQPISTLDFLAAIVKIWWMMNVRELNFKVLIFLGVIQVYFIIFFFFRTYLWAGLSVATSLLLRVWTRDWV